MTKTANLATKGGDFLALTDADWTGSFDLKFFAAVRMVRLAWPHLKAARGGIVNIAGVAGRAGDAESAAGGALNAPLADRGVADGVRVNAINPGTIETDRYKARLERYQAAHKVSADEAAAGMRANEGVARFGKPEEVGALVAMIASRPLDFLHGAVIDFDGGRTRGL